MPKKNQRQSFNLWQKKKKNYIMTKQKVTFFWFRRDLRLEDNTGLFESLQSDFPVIPLFIFDDDILENLPKNDCTEESIESLRKEVERLKTRLEEERKKLNDVTCKALPVLYH